MPEGLQPAFERKRPSDRSDVFRITPFVWLAPRTDVD
jgi:hypothetical protein